MRTHQHSRLFNQLAAATVTMAALAINSPAVADLHIVRVERVDGATTPVTRGQTVNVRVVVNNDGAETVFFHIVQVGGCEDGEVFNVGDEEFVKDGDTKTIEFPICINVDGISGRFTAAARYSTAIFLRARDIKDGVPLFGIIKDGTPDDNFALVSFPAVRLRNLRVTLEQINVHDSMDAISVGDWHVLFSAANFGRGVPTPRYGRRVIGPAWPNDTGTQNVSNGEQLTISRSVDIRGIAESEDLFVEVFAIDCDQHFFFNLGVELTRFGGSALNCTGEEEFWETSGNHDFAGPATIRIPAATWVTAAPGTRTTSRPVPEFTAHISTTRLE